MPAMQTVASSEREPELPSISAAAMICDSASCHLPVATASCHCKPSHLLLSTSCAANAWARAVISYEYHNVNGKSAGNVTQVVLKKHKNVWQRGSNKIKRERWRQLCCNVPYVMPVPGLRLLIPDSELLTVCRY